jgi:Ran GTPase-activating protein (RanGAP) involved in mRNA processing and transport
LGCHGWQYRRGFVEAVGISAGAFLTNATPLFATAPLRELKLYDICGRMSALANCSHLACVETIDLERNDLGDAEMKYLAGASLTQLTTLLLWSNRVGDKGLAALVAAAFPRLRRLDLSYNLIGDVGATALASSPVLGQLALLDLTANQITSRGARALADSPHATTLGRLDLTKNPIDESGQTALRRRFSDRIQVWS